MQKDNILSTTFVREQTFFVLKNKNKNSLEMIKK